MAVTGALKTAHLVQGCWSCLGLLQGYSPAFRGLLDWIRRSTNRASMLPSANRGNRRPDLRVSFVLYLVRSMSEVSSLGFGGHDCVQARCRIQRAGAVARLVVRSFRPATKTPCLQLSPGSHLSSSLPGDRWLPRGVVRPRSYGINPQFRPHVDRGVVDFYPNIKHRFCCQWTNDGQCPMPVIDKIDRWQWRWGITV